MADFDYLTDRPIRPATACSGFQKAVSQGIGGGLREPMEKAVEEAARLHGEGSREWLVLKALLDSL